MGYLCALDQHQIGAEEVGVVSLAHSLHCEHSRLEKDTGWRKEPSKLRTALRAIGLTVLFSLSFRAILIST